MSLLAELNSTAPGVSVMVTVVCTEPVFRLTFTVTSPPVCTRTFSWTNLLNPAISTVTE